MEAGSVSGQAIWMTGLAGPADPIRREREETAARLLVESIRAFGGALADRPIWVFSTDPARQTGRELASAQVEVIPLSVPEAIRRYPFGDKVLACARAEAMAPAGVDSLIWLDLQCLVVRPPLLYDLGADYDVALRPVHIRNVGLSPSEPLDTFWRGVYRAVGVADVGRTVESFVDRQRLRAYFNSHGLAFRPTLGLAGRWYALFERLVHDEAFQAAGCPDEVHQVFLFQALLSALVATTVDWRRVRSLPPTYNYPYNLHGRVPPERRAAALDDLVCLTFEGRSIDPDAMTDIEVREPLRSWLAARVAAG